MSIKTKFRTAGLLAVFFTVSLPSMSSAAGPSPVTKTDIFKAGIATVMGRDPSMMRADRNSGGIIYLSYVREDDGSLWSYKCKIDGSFIIWASDTGRWRDRPDDSRITYRVEADKIYIEEKYSDESATKKSYKLHQIRN